MDRYRYFIFNQKGVLGLGILQVACAGLCVVCGLMDAVFRKDTPLSTTRTPLWGGLIMASPGVLALFASQRKNPVLTFVLHRMVKGANATILLTCAISLVFSSVIGYMGCRSIPLCACYDARTGLESLVPQCDPGDTEMCTLQTGGDNRLFNSPAQTTHKDDPEEEEGSSNLPPYSRLT
uniref:uncharacterized protein zgc:113425 isoform X5 n=1 Tax=Maylandia zebra TaxID=106582 RepID=UPI0006460F6D|nr:uncharacterized protein LOC101473621 isoform X5 [Maylandia zebra]